MTKIHSFFREKGEQLLFDGVMCEVYIPMYYFNNNLAEKHGNVIKTFGLFNFKVFSKEDNKEKVELHLFKFASPIHMTPTNMEKMSLDLYGNGEDDYMVLKFFKGDLFINSLCIAKNADDVLKFITIITAGKLPSNIPYDKVLEIWLNNLSINDTKLGVSSTILELVISEVYRDKKDLGLPFRYRAGGKNKVSMLDYKAVNLKTIANYNSTFTSVTFEDPDYALTTSINKLRYNEKETTSPIEKVIKY